MPSRATFGIKSLREVVRRLQEAQRIADRRWTLLLINGTRVHLPADGMAAALAWLESRAETGLLDARLAVIDLRVAGQLVVRMTDDHSVGAGD